MKINVWIMYVHTRKPLCPEVSLDFFTVKECGLFICIKYINLIFYGCKQEIPNLKANLQIMSELGKMCSLIFGKSSIFLPESQTTRCPFMRMAVQIMHSFEVPCFRITGSF